MSAGIGWNPLLALDANAFVYAFELHPDFGDAACRVFEAAEQGACRLVTSTLTLTEVLVVPKRAGRADLATRYRDLFQHFPQLTVVPLDPAIAEVAADLRARHNVRTPDALHVATAMVAGAVAFVSEDRRLPADLPLPVWRLADAWARIPIE